MAGRHVRRQTSASYELVGISPIQDADHRALLTSHDIVPQDLNDLTQGLG